MASLVVYTKEEIVIRYLAMASYGLVFYLGTISNNRCFYFDLYKSINISFHAIGNCTWAYAKRVTAPNLRKIISFVVFFEKKPEKFPYNTINNWNFIWYPHNTAEYRPRESIIYKRRPTGNEMDQK